MRCIAWRVASDNFTLLGSIPTLEVGFNSSNAWLYTNTPRFCVSALSELPSDAPSVAAATKILPNALDSGLLSTTTP